MRIRAIALALTLTGCAIPAPVTAPAPLQFRVAGTPRTVISKAATTLTLSAFEVAASDADGGNLTMKRPRGPHGNASMISCRGASGSYLDNTVQSTLTVVVVATAAGRDSSDVLVRGSVWTSYPSLIGSGQVVEVDGSCVSSGTAEASVRDAVRG